MRVWAFAAVAALAAGAAAAADNHDVAYGPAPAWVGLPPASASKAGPNGAAAQVIYSDHQDRISADTVERYSAFRVKILGPDGLAMGNVTAQWSPSTDQLTVHELHIIRDGQVIDVLAQTKFRVIEREDNLAYNMLDGTLTATLQAPGVQVGDEIEFAATIRHSDKTFGGKAYGFLALPASASPGAFRLRVLWPDGMAVRWQATPDVGKLSAQEGGGQQALVYQLSDPGSVVVADGAPGRYNVRRLVEYDQFASWNDLARQLAPLFDKAATLAPDSPLRAEAAKIAASTPDLVARAEAALRLVEDQVRYVFVGLDGGGYLPAGADDTWKRRFGDCKAKSVLLAALLRQLGIAGDVVLVSSKGGDGTNEHLPTPEMFDHAVVKATIGGKVYWLDGTRVGDRRLEALPAPEFRWDLPLRADGDLEATPATAPVLPLESIVADVDVSAGFDAPARMKIEHVYRGDVATGLERGLANSATSDAQEAMRQFWRGQYDGLQPEKMGWRYDFTQNAIILTVSGTMRQQWRGDDKSGRVLDVLGAGFTPPNEMQRPAEQDQTAPWVINYPRFSRWTTIVRLPRDIGKWCWAYSDAPMHLRMGGATYWREARLKDGVLISTMSRRALAPEITPADAAALNKALLKFDNAVSTAFESTADGAGGGAPGAYTTSYSALRRMQAAALIKAGKPDEALAAIDEALAREPDDAATLKARADVLTALGRKAEALDDLDEAWRMDPLDPAVASARVAAQAGGARSEDVGAPYDPWQAPAVTAAGAAGAKPSGR